MPRDPRHDVLFEPIRLGPVTAKNRFYQVPHCTGMGWVRPRTLAAMREVKAEGGWGVVCTEYNSIHPTSDDSPGPYASLWDDSDVRAHRLMTDKVHKHGALAGAELWYGGGRTANLMTRETALSPVHMPNLAGHPYQPRAMDKADIRAFRRWHRDAAIRAREAGFDIVYVYATHGYLLAHFLDPQVNTRTDEYGGSLENRTRLVRELIEETKEAVGETCAVACRFAADERIGEDGVPIHGEREEMFAMLAEMPDIWDINIADYSREMGVARFSPEAGLEPYIAYIKGLTTKPVVTVGRFTSPDTMAGQLSRGVVDLIGAARPSIADPFIPMKIDEGRAEDIRECIGCNICYSGDSLAVPIRCTQNPTMGEEWRRGWHPERIAPKGSDSSVLIVGGGPAGMEAARALGQRGYKVMLAEAGTSLGGRVTRECALPGLGSYARVRDYRAQQLLQMPNVEIFFDSRISARDVRDVGADHVALATGARWVPDRWDGKRRVPVATAGARVFTADDLLDGNMPDGPTLVYDEDGYYLGGVLAEAVRATGVPVTLVTPDDAVSDWAGNTSERWRVRSHLHRLGVDIVTAHTLVAYDGGAARLVCTYSDQDITVGVDNVVMVTHRLPEESLWQDLQGDDLPFTVTRIGDCDAPGIVAAAVHSGHRFARSLDADPVLRHDRIDVGLMGNGDLV